MFMRFPNYFDNYARRYFGKTSSQLVAFALFQCLWSAENHKGKMASMVFQMYNHRLAEKRLNYLMLTEIMVPVNRQEIYLCKDVVKLISSSIILKSWVFNCGTGHAHTFNNTLAQGVLKTFWRRRIEYVPFPEVLKGKYQSYTQADATNLWR